jgi:opacity protein-like surface antigen
MFSFGTVDTLFDFHLGGAFLGIGWGVTTKYKEEKAATYGEAVAHLGFDVSKKFSIYVEGRGPVSNVTHKHYRLTLGIRFKL